MNPSNSEQLDLADPNNWIRVHPHLHAKYVMDSQRLHELETDLTLANREIERLKRQEIPAAVSRGAHTVIPAKERELRRARAAESLLRHVERLLRNDEKYQRIRATIGEHLAEYRDYEQRPPDEVRDAS